jgi:hypothetical protein
MNERIQQLAEQALQLVADKHTNGDESRLNTDSYHVKDLIQEKFAELIVRECVSICYAESRTAGANGNLAEYSALSKAGGHIKDHFGVKE